MQVRPCADADEMRAAFAPIWHYFGQNPPPGDTLKHFVRILPPERVHAAFEGDRAVAGSGVFAFDLTVPGGQVSAAGLTIVGVLPTHRRRGLLRAMMRSQIDAAHARGEPVMVFWPSDDRIYPQFGCGMASMMAEIDVPREHAAAYAASDAAADVRLVPLAEAEPLLTAIYDRVARQTPGMFARSSAWWQDRLLVDADWKRRGGGALQCAVLDIDGGPSAYALYRVNQTIEHGSGIGHTLAVEAMGVSPQATHAIWRFLFGIDWMARVKAYLLPVDHPLLLAVAEPRRLNFHLREGIWVRLIDVDAALSARSYASDDAIVVEVADEFCSWNDGRWRIARGGVTRTDAPADLACEVASLGCAYLGGFSFAELACAMRVRELADGAIARADALFRTDRKPWCPEIF
jgi:predicted acetyltransferase